MITQVFNHFKSCIILYIKSESSHNHWNLLQNFLQLFGMVLRYGYSYNVVVREGYYVIQSDNDIKRLYI